MLLLTNPSFHLVGQSKALTVKATQFLSREIMESKGLLLLSNIINKMQIKRTTLPSFDYYLT